jgi:hypothetical protein
MPQPVEASAPSFERPRLFERIDAALNPLMVKEAHQSFRNRALLIMGFFALGVPLLVFMGTIASSTNPDSMPYYPGSERAGEQLFRTLSGFAMLVTWVAVPVRAAAMLHAEVRSHTLELTVLTSLTPWQLASGRFQAAALQTLLLLAFLAPFCIASIALGGVGADRVLLNLMLIFVVGLMQCSAALLTVTAASLAPRLLALFALLGLGELFFVFTFGVAFVSDVFASTDSWVWLAWAAQASVATAFFLRLSADMLAPAGMRSYVWSKLMMVGLLALLYALPMAGSLLSLSIGDDEGFLFAGAFGLCAFGLLWSGADRRPGSAGKLGFLLEDGIGPTTAYVVVLLGAIAIGAALAEWEVWIAIAFLVYFVELVGIAALLQALWLARSAEGFFTSVLIVAVINLVLTFVVLAQGGWSLGNDDPAQAAVLLPFVWAARESRVLQPVTALPFVVGVAALLAAHARRRKHG